MDLTNINGNSPLVGVVIGSDSDLPVLDDMFDKLDDFGFPYEAKILSAHRTSEEATEYAKTAAPRGLRILIAVAGHAAHLAGILAANTHLPVIGVPIGSSCLNGMDALLSTVQMPSGVPVATMAIGKSGATNAAILATKILAICTDLNELGLIEKLLKHKAKMAEGVLKKQLMLDVAMESRKFNKAGRNQ